MNITQDAVVEIHYTLKNDSGQTLDSSAGGEPLAYLHGNGNMIPGLESALEGKSVGDKLSVRIAPEDAYGLRDSSLVQDVPRQAFPPDVDIQVGMQFQAQSNQGPRMVTIAHVSADTITVDGNHPLAGENLNFDVEVTGVRQATEEELQHGHVHGPGGHHHG